MDFAHGELEKYIGKMVLVFTKDGRTLQGKATSFTPALGSDSGFDELDIEYPTHIECVDTSEIRNIQILED
jgi:hypothetical protein